MARKIQADQALEDHAPAGLGRRQKHQQAGSGAAVRHHVQNGAEAGRLLEPASCVAVEGVEEAADAVEEGAAARVQGHEVEGGERKDDAGVS